MPAMSQLAEHCEPPSYIPRRPEETPLYQIVQASYKTFVADREAEDRPVPEYVKKEFEGYLKCGLVQFGFLRLSCSSCGEESVCAFSCKFRGFCPACCAKRMVEASTHLVENVLPHVPYRQFVISFPIPMRYWLNTNKKLFNKVHRIVIEQIHGYYKNEAEAKGIKGSTPGSISFTQRWGSDLRLNPHLHVLSADGVFTRVDGKPLFRKFTDINDEDVEGIIENISSKVRKYLIRRGYLDKEGEIVENPIADELFAEHESLDIATARSIQGRVAFGPDAGQYLRKIGPGFGFREEIPLAKGKLCYSLNNFSIHAKTAIKTTQRERLEKLIQYVARGPISNERVEIIGDETVRLQLKRPYSDGTTHLEMSFQDVMAKLMALIPPPRAHLVRWAGFLAPNSPYRKEITLRPEIKKKMQFQGDEDERKLVKNHRWARNLARIFKVDVATCKLCKGDIKIIAAVTSPPSIARYLRHLGLDPDPPVWAPAKQRQESLALSDISPHDELPIISDL